MEVVLSGRLYKLDGYFSSPVWGSGPTAKFESSRLAAIVDQICNVSMARGSGALHGEPVVYLEPIIQIL